jgi:hypothetical protein
MWICSPPVFAPAREQPIFMWQRFVLVGFIQWIPTTLRYIRLLVAMLCAMVPAAIRAEAFATAERCATADPHV